MDKYEWTGKDGCLHRVERVDDGLSSSPRVIAIDFLGNGPDSGIAEEAEEELLRLAGEIERLQAALESQCEIMNDLLQRTADGYMGMVEGLESEVHQLREMNEGHLERIAELESGLAVGGRQIDALCATRDALRVELAEAREKGLQLGNAALKQGWRDCEEAVSEGLLDTADERSRSNDHAPAIWLRASAIDIRNGLYRPEGFDSHDPEPKHQTPENTWTGADEVEAGEATHRGTFPAPAGLPEEDPDLDDHPGADAAKVGTPRPPTEAEIAYGQGLALQIGQRWDEEARAAAAEGEAPCGGVAPGTLIQVDPKPLLGLAFEAGHIEGFGNAAGLTGSAVLRYLREAGVIPGE